MNEDSEDILDKLIDIQDEFEKSLIEDYSIILQGESVWRINLFS